MRYAYEHCDYVANPTSSLESHEESKHVGMKYQCDECNSIASRQDNLKKYIKHEAHVAILQTWNILFVITHLNYYIDTLYCALCGLCFRILIQLKVHLETVHEEALGFLVPFVAKFSALRASLKGTLEENMMEQNSMNAIVILC